MSTPQLDLGFEPAGGAAAPVVKTKARNPRTTPAVPADPETLARELEKHPDFRVLRRLVPRRQFEPAQGPVRRVLVLDTETTGLDQAKDKIIELAEEVYGVDIKKKLEPKPSSGAGNTEKS